MRELRDSQLKAALEDLRKAAILMDTRNSALCVQLEGQGLVTVDVAGDGNCFFRAASYAIHGNDTSYQILRQQVASHIEQSGVMLGGWTNVSPDDGKNFKQHIQLLRTDREAVGEDAVKALSELFHRDVIVYIANALPLVYSPNGGRRSGDGPIRLAFFEPGHYRAVISPPSSDLLYPIDKWPGN